MKKLLFIVTSWLLMALPTLAQEGLDMDDPEVRQAVLVWMKDIQKQQQKATGQIQKTGISVQNDPVLRQLGGIHVYPIEKLPIPDNAKQSLRNSTQNAKQGVRTVSSDRVLTEAQAKERLSRWHSLPLEVVSQSLTFRPADVSATPLATGTLLDVGSVGTTLPGGLSTGLTRTFQIPGMGTITFDEVDYPSSPTMGLIFVEEAFNTEVKDVQAIARAARTKDGRGSASLRWVTPARSYQLSLITDNGSHLEQDQQVLKNIARQLVEHKSSE